MRTMLLKVACGACTVALIGCYDLTVQDQSGRTRDELFADPQAVETHTATVFTNLWMGMHNALPWQAIATWGEEITSSNDLNFIWAVGQEPRPPIDNAPVTGTTSGLMYAPWHRLYEGNSYSVDMLREIANRRYKIINRQTGLDETTRTVAFAKFVHAMSHIYLGLMYDQAAIIPEGTDLAAPEIPRIPLSPYREVLDSGFTWMERAIDLVDSASFVLPRLQQLWIYGQQVGSADLVRVMRSYLGRSMVYAARTPEERDAVDWEKVKALISSDSGILQDFGPGGFGSRPVSWANVGYWMLISSDGSGTTSNRQSPHAARVDLRLLGPGDTTGAYQVWLAKADAPGRDSVVPAVLGSPDRRIQIGGSPGAPGNGTIFRFTPNRPPDSQTNGMPASRGAYYYSNYYSLARARPSDGCNQSNSATACLWGVQQVSLTVDEMNLLTAEAELRLGNPEVAAALINISRQRDGGLPPVDVNGPPQATAAEQASCVPKRYDGTCGDLFDALFYEKRIQLYGREGLIAWADLRGWGCLLEGTPLHLPVPTSDLDLLDVPRYTFGGRPGEPGSAPLPGDCPLMVNPNVRRLP